MKRLIHRSMRSVGLHIEKHRDAVSDFANLAGDARCVVDGGAYHFSVSRKFLKLFPNAQIHAFEPNPDLDEYAPKDRRFTYYGAALGAANGESTLHVPDKAFTASLLDPEGRFGESVNCCVKVVRLDGLGIRPDAIKLDLQGGELAALQGAESLMGFVRVVLCEVNFVPRYQGCAMFHEIASWLARHGLNLHRIYEVHADRWGQWQFADAIFSRM